jgi:hypothetical protein
VTIHATRRCTSRKSDWSVRAGSGHRALGMEIEDGILWFWIGTHAEYKRLIQEG